LRSVCVATPPTMCLVHYPGVREKGTKNKVGLQEAFADRQRQTRIQLEQHDAATLDRSTMV
jgi:hypothetical protein